MIFNCIRIVWLKMKRAQLLSQHLYRFVFHGHCHAPSLFALPVYHCLYSCLGIFHSCILSQGVLYLCAYKESLVSWPYSHIICIPVISLLFLVSTCLLRYYYPLFSLLTNKRPTHCNIVRIQHIHPCLLIVFNCNTLHWFTPAASPKVIKKAI